LRNKLFVADIYIDNRKSAMHGDYVVLRLNPANGGSPHAATAVPAAAAAAAVPTAPQPALPTIDENFTDVTTRLNDAPVGVVDESAGGPHLPDGRRIKKVLDPALNARITGKQILPVQMHMDLCPGPRHLGHALDAWRIGRSTEDKARETLMLSAQVAAFTRTWCNPSGQVHGDVVYIVQRESAPARRLACVFATTPVPPRMEANRWYRFKPYDDSFPIIAVRGRDVPDAYRDTPDKFLHLIQYEPDADITKPTLSTDHWADGRFPYGAMLRPLGSATGVAEQSRLIAFMNKVKDVAFSDEIVASITAPDMTPAGLKNRRDLRETEFVCTIDPATARDLDDALSIKRLPNGCYRVGVHIADVSHFVRPGTQVDDEARFRATSTYLVERVIPMLPHKLCEDYCSLNAGVDKFAFSVLWTIDKTGKIQDEWFGQSIIRNRCRMAYEDAQYIIDGNLSGDSLKFVNEAEPREVLVAKVVEAVQTLFELAGTLRKTRYEKGALSLNKAKLSFEFEDMNSPLAPRGIKFERQREANWLIEEFMLLANFRVAEKVVEWMPECTLLRKHGAPKTKKVRDFVALMHSFGFSEFTLGAKTALPLRKALECYKTHPQSDVLNLLALFTMQRAQYCNSGTADEDPNDPFSAKNADIAHLLSSDIAQNALRHNPKDGPHDADEPEATESCRHYALAAPFYSHFTSPIRRYADLITHRQLLLALDIERAAKLSGQSHFIVTSDALAKLDHGKYFYPAAEITDIALNCNERKEAAKQAGQMSGWMFLGLFIEAARARVQAATGIEGRFYATGVVVRVMKDTFTVHLPQFSIEVEIFHNAKAQRWNEEGNQVKGNEFVIGWGAESEKCTVMSKFVGEIVVQHNPVTSISYIILPPAERSSVQIFDPKTKL
jgi:DIS3-like exonuclease 2